METPLIFRETVSGSLINEIAECAVLSSTQVSHYKPNKTHFYSFILLLLGTNTVPVTSNCFGNCNGQPEA